ncbi:MAG: FecR domain-containing protein [Verrucomicrobiota bacterium]
MTDEHFMYLVLRYFDDALDEAGMAELNSELASSHQRVRLFNDLRVHAMEVRDGIAQMEGVAAPEPELLAFPKPKKVAVQGLLAASFSAAAALVIGAVYLFDMLQQQGGRENPWVARFVGGSEAVFGSDGVLEEGTTLRKGKYRLSEGVAEVRFRMGATVTLEAPASFEVLDVNAMSLKRGTLLAKVPEPAIGFEVITEKAFVRDLGTEFGVSVKKGGETDVVVFQGLVEMGSEGGPMKRLATGEGRRVLTNGQFEPLEANFESYRFPGTVPVSKPKRVGENLVENHSFEVGPLSRGPYSAELYRDVPSGWTATVRNEGEVKDAKETFSGVISLPLASGGYPAAVHGERYAWIQHGDLRQEVGVLEPGVTYKLIVSLASHPDITKGSSLPFDVEEENKYVIGLESESKPLKKVRGVLEPGTAFHELELEFTCPPDHAQAGMPMEVVLSGKKRVFYDEVRLEKVSKEQ